MRQGSVTAVDGISFSVGEGECVGMVGESGCGKCTTGLSIMRLLPNNGHMTGGSVTLLGRDLAPLDEKQMRQVRGERGRAHPPGPDDLAQPDDDDRQADRRRGPAAPRRHQGRRPESGRSRC